MENVTKEKKTNYEDFKQQFDTIIEAKLIKTMQKQSNRRNIEEKEKMMMEREMMLQRC